MTGAETLVQQDVTEDRLRHNAVAYGGWYMDSHPSGGLMSEKEYVGSVPFIAMASRLAACIIRR